MSSDNNIYYFTMDTEFVEIRDDEPFEPYPLHMAVQVNDVLSVRTLLEDIPEVINDHDDHGKTPLHYAFHVGHVIIAAFLVANGANVNAKDAAGETPFHILCRVKYHLEIKRELLRIIQNCGSLDQGLQMNRLGMTPLHLAVQENDIDLVDMLLLFQAVIVDVADDLGKTALHHAFHAGNLDMAELLLEEGANVDAKDLNGYTSLHIICLEHFDLDVKEELVMLLMCNGANVDIEECKGLTALQMAVQACDVNLVNMLLQRRAANVNTANRFGKTALHYAIHLGHLEIAEVLIVYGADVNVRDLTGNTPLHIICRASYDLALKHHLINLLLENSLDVRIQEDILGLSPLHVAVVVNHIHSVITLLAQNGALVNIPDNFGKAPLHYAIHIGNLEITQVLLDGGANVNARDLNGMTPLHILCRATHDLEIKEEFARLLVEYGLDLNLQMDNLGFEPLHVAVLIGSVTSVRMLLSLGIAAINAIDRRGATAYNYAVETGNFEIIQMLLICGAADRSEFSSDGSPLQSSSTNSDTPPSPTG